MIRLPVANAVEYLVERRFPNYKALSSKRYVPLSETGRSAVAPAEQRHRLSQEVEEYRAVLKAKTPEQLYALLEEEQAKELEALRLKAELEERARFFNLPTAKADFVHWSKAIYWTLDEALALAFGRAPEVVKWDKVQPYAEVSPFARQYVRVRDLAIRANNWQQLFDPVAPGIFLAWARRAEIDVPEELVKAVEARGIVIGDWKDLYDKLKARFDALVEERDKIERLCTSLTESRDALNVRVAELEEQAVAWQFDESAESYPAELDMAMQAWRAVSNRRDGSLTVKQQLVAWLEEHYQKLTEEAKERIATVCNWEKRGGRPTGG